MKEGENEEVMETGEGQPGASGREGAKSPGKVNPFISRRDRTSSRPYCRTENLLQRSLLLLSQSPYPRSRQERRRS